MLQTTNYQLQAKNGGVDIYKYFFYFVINLTFYNFGGMVDG